MAGLLDYLAAAQNGGLLGGSPFDPQTFAPTQQGAAMGDPSGLGVLRQLLGRMAPSGNYGPSPIGPMSPEGVVMPSDMTGPPPRPMPQVPQTANSAPALPPPTNIATMPMPQSVEPSQTAIPPAATPVMQQGQPQMAPQQTQQPGLFDRLLGGISNNPNTLMGMGAALMGGQGYGGAFKNAMAGQQMDLQNHNRTVTANALLSSLVSRGYKPEQAWAIAQSAAADPKIAEALLPQALGLKPPETVEGVIAKRLEQGGAGAQGAMGVYNDFKRGQAAVEAEGKAQGGIAASLPNATASVDSTLSAIDALAKDPTLSSVVGGPLVGRNPGLTGPQNSTIARIQQLSGQLVTDAIQSMRGAGVRLTQQEINQIQQGAARLQRTQDLPSFQASLSDLRDQMVGMRTRLGQMAGGAPTPPEQAQASPSFTQDQLRAEAVRRGLIK